MVLLLLGINIAVVAYMDTMIIYDDKSWKPSGYVFGDGGTLQHLPANFGIGDMQTISSTARNDQDAEEKTKSELEASGYDVSDMEIYNTKTGWVVTATGTKETNSGKQSPYEAKRIVYDGAIYDPQSGRILSGDIDVVNEIMSQRILEDSSPNIRVVAAKTSEHLLGWVYSTYELDTSGWNSVIGGQCKLSKRSFLIDRFGKVHELWTRELAAKRNSDISDNVPN